MDKEDLQIIRGIIDCGLTNRDCLWEYPNSPYYYECFGTNNDSQRVFYTIDWNGVVTVQL